jgi:hypothetical protein
MQFKLAWPKGWKTFGEKLLKAEGEQDFRQEAA